LVPQSWAATELERAEVQARLLAPPFALAKQESQATRRFGLEQTVQAGLVQAPSLSPGRTWGPFYCSVQGQR
jgi:hypothetical protein